MLSVLGFEVLKFFQYLERQKGFCIRLPVLLLIGGKWLANFPISNIPKVLPPCDNTSQYIQINQPIECTQAADQIEDSSGNTLTILPGEEKPIERYGVLELALQTDVPAVNPYDPKEIEIKVRFTAPSGRNVDVGAFWYQGYDPETRQPKGEPGWKVRFTPDEAGEWSAVAYNPKAGNQQ